MKTLDGVPLRRMIPEAPDKIRVMNSDVYRINDLYVISRDSANLCAYVLGSSSRHGRNGSLREGLRVLAFWEDSIGFRPKRSWSYSPPSQRLLRGDSETEAP